MYSSNPVLTLDLNPCLRDGVCERVERLDILALCELRGVLGHDLPVLQGALSVVLGEDRENPLMCDRIITLGDDDLTLPEGGFLLPEDYGRGLPEVREVLVHDLREEVVGHSRGAPLVAAARTVRRQAQRPGCAAEEAVNSTGGSNYELHILRHVLAMQPINLGASHRGTRSTRRLREL